MLYPGIVLTAAVFWLTREWQK